MIELTETAPSPASIVHRQEINAPADYVSIFHETTTKAIPSIDTYGLLTNDESDVDPDDLLQRTNAVIDNDRPDRFVQTGISRSTNIYAYPFLHEGHSLYGAARRFMTPNRKQQENEFEAQKKYGREALATMGITTVDEFAVKMRDPAYLRQQYPGEILELKVDPERCFVGDLTEVNNMFASINRREFEAGDAKSYWASLITLKDFMKWYKKAEWEVDGNATGNYCPLAGAPAEYPRMIMQPEILVPDDIPQEHIKLVQ